MKVSEPVNSERRTWSLIVEYLTGGPFLLLINKVLKQKSYSRYNTGYLLGKNSMGQTDILVLTRYPSRHDSTLPGLNFF